MGTVGDDVSASHSVVAASGPWSLGVLIGVPLAALLFLVVVGWGAVMFALGMRRKKTGYGNSARMVRDPYLIWSGVAIAVVGGLIVAGGFVFAMWPFNSQFHQWRSVHGTVQQISSRLIASDKSMSQRYVVVIDGQQFGIDDTRASLLHKGDQVSLKCKREYQFQSVSGWACRWN